MANKFNGVKRIVSFAFWIGLWHCVSLCLNNPLILPGPFNVLVSLVEIAREKVFYLCALSTLFRILLGFSLGLFIALAFSLLTCANSFCYALFSPVIKTVRTTPVASFIILTLLWLGKNYVPVLISLLMVVPVIWENVDASFRVVNADLLEMARAYRLTKWKTLRYIIFPSVLPSFKAASLTAMGLAWKSGIAAEVLSQPKNALGSKLYYSKIYLETENLFAYTIVVVVLSLVIERLIKHFLEKSIKKERAI